MSDQDIPTPADLFGEERAKILETAKRHVLETLDGTAPSEILKQLQAYALERNCSSMLRAHSLGLQCGIFRLGHARWAVNDGPQELHVFGDTIQLVIFDEPGQASQDDFDTHKPETIGDFNRIDTASAVEITTLEQGKAAIDQWCAALADADEKPWFYRETRLPTKEGLGTKDGWPLRFHDAPPGFQYKLKPPPEATQRYLAFIAAQLPGTLPTDSPEVAIRRYLDSLQTQVIDETTNATGLGVAGSNDTQTTRRVRGQAINIRAPFLIGTDKATRAFTSALFNPSMGNYLEDGTYRWHNQADTKLDVGIFPDKAQPAIQISDFVKNLDVLSLKALFGAMRVWADQTKAQRYNDYADIPLSTLIKATGYTSNINSKIQKNYLSAFFALAAVYVEVPDQQKYITVNGKPTPDPKQTIRRTWQRILNSDQISVTNGLFGDDPEFTVQEVWSIGFHPAQFMFNNFYGEESGQRQFAKISDKILRLDTNRQGNIIKLAIYYAQLERIHYGAGNTKDKQKLSRRKGVLSLQTKTICDDAGITPTKNNLGTWIARFKAWHTTLNANGLANVKFIDPGEELGPTQRLQEIRIEIHPT